MLDGRCVASLAVRRAMLQCLPTQMLLKCAFSARPLRDVLRGSRAGLRSRLCHRLLAVRATLADCLGARQTEISLKSRSLKLSSPAWAPRAPSQAAAPPATVQKAVKAWHIEHVRRQDSSIKCTLANYHQLAKIRVSKNIWVSSNRIERKRETTHPSDRCHPCVGLVGRVGANIVLPARCDDAHPAPIFGRRRPPVGVGHRYCYKPSPRQKAGNA